jgi:hypothetical protein
VRTAAGAWIEPDTGRYTLGMRNVLLIIKVPERTNSKANGCRSHGPNVHTPQ